MKTKALIVDDESDARDLLELLLRDYFPEIELYKAETLIEADSFLKTNAVDLLFLDIQLGHRNGFELLETINTEDVAIIFVTAYDQYALKAIKASARDYVLKPIDEIEFKEVVEKVLKQIQSASAILPEQKIGLISKIGLPGLEGLDFVDVDRIIHCEADNNYTRVYLNNEPQKLISKTLLKFEEDLKLHGFLRVHHKHLVNLKQIKAYRKGNGGGHLIMIDDSVIPVSSRKKSKLLAAFC